MNARDRLAAIAARADAATPGPWSVRLDGREIYGPDGWWIGQFQRESDSALALAARTDVPALVAFATAVLDLHKPGEVYGLDDQCLGCHEAVRDGAGIDYVDCPISALADEHLGGTS